MRALLTVGLAVAAALASAGASPAAPAVYETQATAVPEYAVGLSAQESVTFETAAASPGSDPVLHLLDPRGREVAIANGTRLEYRAPSKQTYWLVVRARSNTSAGAADLLRNGVRWQTGVRFAGSDHLLAGLRRGELLETVRLQAGAGPTHSLYVLKTNGLGIERRVVGGGVAGAARFNITTETGTRHVVLGVPARRTGPLGGRVRLPGRSGCCVTTGHSQVTMPTATAWGTNSRARSARAHRSRRPSPASPARHSPTGATPTATASPTASRFAACDGRRRRLASRASVKRIWRSRYGARTRVTRTSSWRSTSCAARKSENDNKTSSTCRRTWPGPSLPTTATP